MKKVLMIIGGIVVVIIVIIVVMFVVVSMTSKKLVCKSDDNNITIMYNDDTITGYTAKGISYDLEGQKKLVEAMGVKSYLNWFVDLYRINNDNATCTFEE